MLKKRLVGVITVKDGWAVQSFGYNSYLPVGKPECLAENLNRWGADEILVLCIDRSRSGHGPDFELLRRLSRLGLATPLIYGGGIGSVEDGIPVIQAGADRICLDGLLHDDMESVLGLSERLGAQALIAALPLSEKNRTLKWLDYRHGSSGSLSDSVLDALNTGVISEALIIDWQHEGVPQRFDVELIKLFPMDGVPLIAFGGLSDPDQIGQVLSLPQVVAVAVGNFLSYREHAIQTIKEKLAGLPLRAPAYDATYSMLPYV